VTVQTNGGFFSVCDAGGFFSVCVAFLNGMPANQGHRKRLERLCLKFLISRFID
jgi:hypothetical protein